MARNRAASRRRSRPTRTEETAVMIDTFAPLEISDQARSVAVDDYPWSWAGPDH